MHIYTNDYHFMKSMYMCNDEIQTREKKQPKPLNTEASEKPQNQMNIHARTHIH